MNALILTTQYPNQQEPTRGMYHLQIMRELQTFCDIRVVAPVQYPYPFPPYRIYKDVPDYEVWEGVQTWHPRYAHLPIVGRSATGLLYAKSVWPTVRRLHQTSPFDVIAAYFAYPDGYAAVEMGCKLGVPVVIGVLGSDVNRMLFEGVRKHIVRKTLKEADHVLSVSSALAQRVASVGIDADKIQVITNGVDAGQFCWRDSTQVRQQLGLPLNRRILLFAGWLVELKGLIELVHAIRELVEGAKQGMNGHEDILLTLVGTGPLEPELRELIQKYGLEDHVWLMGARPHEEVALWMNACDLFCLPSWMEGCPNVVVEARASGKPVVASNVGGIPDLIPDARYGLLVPPRDTQALAKALQLALEREWHHETILALAHQHTWRDVARETYQRLQSVAQSHPQRQQKNNTG